MQATTFTGTTRLAAGPLLANALAVHAAQADPGAGPFLTFDDATGRVVDLDLRGDATALAARYAETGPAATASGSWTA